MEWILSTNTLKYWKMTGIIRVATGTRDNRLYLQCVSLPLWNMTLPKIFNKYLRKTREKGLQILIGVPINNLEVKGRDSSAILLLP